MFLAAAVVLTPVLARAQSDAIQLDPVKVEAPHVFHPPTYRSAPPPSYPPYARDRGLEGTGLFGVKVLKDGHVGEVEGESQHGRDHPRRGGRADDQDVALRAGPARSEYRGELGRGPGALLAEGAMSAPSGSRPGSPRPRPPGQPFRGIMSA